jgi:peptidoglycan hydrolase-like protein with peptidoglycan-binding domain
MRARVFGVRAAVVGVLAAAAVGVTAGAGTAAACAAGNQSRSDTFASTLPGVIPGQHGTAVVGLQLALRGQGYALQGTGYYGTLTLHAVRDYQRKHGISSTGIVGSRTWHALVGSKPPTLTGQGRVQVPSRGLRPGARDRELMDQLANMIQRVHPYGPRLPESSETYTPRWQALVKDFQRRNGITASGIVGPKTWHALVAVVSIEGGWGC